MFQAYVDPTQIGGSHPTAPSYLGQLHPDEESRQGPLQERCGTFRVWLWARCNGPLGLTRGQRSQCQPRLSHEAKLAGTGLRELVNRLPKRVETCVYARPSHQ